MDTFCGAFSGALCGREVVLTWLASCRFACHILSMAQPHPHTGATYRVIRRPDMSFAAEVTILGSTNARSKTILQVGVGADAQRRNLRHHFDCSFRGLLCGRDVARDEYQSFSDLRSKASAISAKARAASAIRLLILPSSVERA